MKAARRKDPAAEKRLLHAALYVVAALLGMGGAIVVMSRTANGGAANGWAMALAAVFLLAVFASVVNVVRVRLWYHCPRCRARVSQMPDLLPGTPILYLCPTCNIEWDIGWNVQEGSSN
jgi:hypothetical protein